MKHTCFELLIYNITEEEFVIAYQSDDRNEVYDMLIKADEIGLLACMSEHSWIEGE